LFWIPLSRGDESSDPQELRDLLQALGDEAEAAGIRPGDLFRGGTKMIGAGGGMRASRASISALPRMKAARAASLGFGVSVIRLSVRREFVLSA